MELMEAWLTNEGNVKRNDRKDAITKHKSNIKE